MNFLAIDIGERLMTYALVTATGEIVVKGNQLTQRADWVTFMANLSGLIDRHATDIAGVGLALPGVVDPVKGMCLRCPALPFLEGQALAAALQRNLAIKLPLVLESRMHAAALAEKWQGRLTNVSDGALVSIGHSIEVAVFIDDHLYRGAHALGGLASLMVIDATNPDATGQSAMGLSADGFLASVASKLDLRGAQLATQVFHALMAEEPAAVQAFRAFTKAIAILLYNLQSVLDLQRIVVGGPLSTQPLLATQLSTEFAQLRVDAVLAPQVLATPEIVSTRFEHDACLIGAVYPLTR